MNLPTRHTESTGGKNRRNPIEFDPLWRTCFGYVVVPKQCTRTYVHEYSISWLDVNIPSYRSVCLGRKLLIGTPQRCDGLPYGWVWRYASFQFSQGTALGLRYAGICSPLLRSRTGSSAPSALVRNCVTRFETALDHLVGIVRAARVSRAQQAVRLEKLLDQFK